jgi:phenylacetic acid degradation operon negative regulatory protein
MKTRIPPRLSLFLYDVLDIIEDMAFFASRPGMTRMSRYWGYAEERAAYRAFQRWETLQYLEAEYKGEQVLYRLGDKGRDLLQRTRPSADVRRRTWDGRWRMVVFDFPEVARKARDAFRRTLQDQRLGCLQKSVWISPDPIIPQWKKLLKEIKLTDWVLLFESAELGPVSDVEVAERVWSLKDLDSRYKQHVAAFGSVARRLRSARSFSALEGELGCDARRASQAYFDILRDDPLLPMALLPSGYAGIEADALHKTVRTELRRLLLEQKP